ncbi:MAG: hypothetical protein V1661_00635 [bacterium]
MVDIYQGGKMLKRFKRFPPEQLKNLKRALDELAEAKKNDKTDYRIVHLDAVTMQIWADGDLPADYLDKVLAGQWKEHYESCAGCQNLVRMYKEERGTK